MIHTDVDRPFTARVNLLRDLQYRYTDLAEQSLGARSTSWFNNLVTADDPWVVSPPPRDTWPGLARLFEVSVSSVQEMVAKEWFKAARPDDVPARVRSLASPLERLTAEDFQLVRNLTLRLAPPLDLDFSDSPFDETEENPPVAPAKPGKEE